MKLKRVRGGAWYGVARGARCACRLGLTPGYRGHDVGFRCCFSHSLMKGKVKNEKGKVRNEN